MLLDATVYSVYTGPMYPAVLRKPSDQMGRSPAMHGEWIMSICATLTLGIGRWRKE
jgi:hypothetical protein